MDTTAIKTKTAATKGKTDNKPFQIFHCLRAVVLTGGSGSHSCAEEAEASAPRGVAVGPHGWESAASVQMLADQLIT